MYLEGCRSTSKLFKVLDSLLDEKLCSFENILEALLLVESVRDLTHIRRRTDIAFQRLNTKWSQTKCIAVKTAQIISKNILAQLPIIFESLSLMPGTSRPAC